MREAFRGTQGFEGKDNCNHSVVISEQPVSAMKKEGTQIVWPERQTEGNEKWLESTRQRYWRERGTHNVLHWQRKVENEVYRLLELSFGHNGRNVLWMRVAKARGIDTSI